MGGRKRRFVCTLYLPFLNHVHDPDATQNDTRAVEVFEPQSVAQFTPTSLLGHRTKINPLSFGHDRYR